MNIKIFKANGEKYNKNVNNSLNEIIIDYLTDSENIKVVFENVFIVNENGLYQIDEAYRVPEQIVKENLLIYPIRVKMHLVKGSEKFKNLVAESAKPFLKHIDTAFTGYKNFDILKNR